MMSFECFLGRTEIKETRRSLGILNVDISDKIQVVEALDSSLGLESPSAAGIQ